MYWQVYKAYMLLSLTTNEHDTALADDIYTIAKEAVRKRGRRFSWLRFARPTRTGWSFFHKKAVPWEVLEEIYQEVRKRHATCCSEGKVADMLSGLINKPTKPFYAI